MNETVAREKVAAVAAKHAAGGSTANQNDFADFLLEASGFTGSDREVAAFKAAARLAPHCYKLFQESKPTSAKHTAETTPEPVAPVVKAKPTRKATPAKVETVVEPEPTAKAAPVRKPRAARKTTTAKASA